MILIFCRRIGLTEPNGEVFFSQTTSFSVPQVLNWTEGTKLIFGLVNTKTCSIKNFNLIGTISVDPQWVALDAFNTIDINSKVEYIPFRPPYEPYPYGYPKGPLLPGQYPKPDSYYAWTSNVIPYKTSTTAPPGTPNPDGYQKYQSIPLGLGFYVGLDFITLPPDDPEVILFLTNYQDRGNRSGVQNYKKMEYMTALTADVVPYYNDKINAFLNQLVSNFTMYNKPVLSSFQTSLIQWFLSLHVGYDNYPDYVTNYFLDFLNIIGIGNPTDPQQNAYEIYGNTVVPEVKAYFMSRINTIVQNGDKTCFTYWWNLAGMPIGTMVIEAVHNIFAFSQYNNITFLTIRDKYLGGTPNVFDSTHKQYITYDFFSKITAAQTDMDKINVVREMFRILSPNPASFSKVNKVTPDPNIVTSRHAHQEIMVTNSFGYPWFPNKTGNPGFVDPAKVANYYTYDTTKYANFTASFGTCPVTGAKAQVKNCPMAKSIKDTTSSCTTDNADPTTLFTVSSVDNQTVLDKSQPGFMPVYQTPIYMPFGLGYRRCAAEIFNYLTVIKLLETLAQMQFWQSNAPTSTKVTIGPFVQANDNIYAKTLSNPGPQNP